jgi:hypothetical protein
MMTDCQYHGICAPLWLVAANVESSPWFALACGVFFAGHCLAGAWAKYREVRHG